MITVRPAHERGHRDFGWLDTNHTFSFGHYYDPAHVQFRQLRVINEDRVAPKQGFGEHGHADMEIISYVVSGELAHKDSTGSVSSIGRGGVQVMSAGSGVTHSEFNHSETDPVHFLQIWLMPSERGAEPRYDERVFDDDEKRGKLLPIVTGVEDDGALTIGQDAKLYSSLLPSGESVSHEFAPTRAGWLQVVSGELDVNGTVLRSGDGAAIEDEAQIEVRAQEDAEFLLFDLA